MTTERETHEGKPRPRQRAAAAAGVAIDTLLVDLSSLRAEVMAKGARLHSQHNC